MAPTFSKRDESGDASLSPSPWSTTTFLAIGVASVLLLIAIGATIFFLRRRRSFQLGQCERDSVSRLSWSPVTTLNSTPFASHTNSPMRPSPWEKGALHYSESFSGSRVGSFYTSTPDTAPSSPCALLRSRSALHLPLGSVEDKDKSEAKAHGEAEEEEDKRSISPLHLSPHLARLPSVKAGPTSRVSELVRGSVLLGGTTFEGQPQNGPNLKPMASLATPHAETPGSPPKIDTWMGVLGRRCDLFSASDIHDLFQVRGSGPTVTTVPDVVGSTELGRQS